MNVFTRKFPCFRIEDRGSEGTRGKFNPETHKTSLTYSTQGPVPSQFEQLSRGPGAQRPSLLRSTTKILRKFKLFSKAGETITIGPPNSKLELNWKMHVVSVSPKIQNINGATLAWEPAKTLRRRWQAYMQKIAWTIWTHGIIVKCHKLKSSSNI